MIFLTLTRQKIQARKSISKSHLLAEYVHSNGDIESELFDESLKKVSEIFSVPTDKLRLEDVIGQDIGRSFPLSMGDSMATEGFYEYIHEQKKQTNLAYDKPINTIADFMEFNNFFYHMKQT
ncbi:hypothetical protein [Zooshikella ganghwensis]|uniref:Uncharacterized protein n=1 Tax=Zooshikella ganghwensis TaxID=202772 RepID=A0A4P9VQW4_9GAMM|nr:hypothetical protein [Zooshikella ganghwensis]RDH44987.1 hypothetical protein B9G39_16945 [Zooshikella ganghwensis]